MGILNLKIYSCLRYQYLQNNIMMGLFQLLLGKVRRILCLQAAPYNAVPTDVAFTDATSELSYDPPARELDNTGPLGKTHTLALEKVLREIRSYLKDLSARDQSEFALRAAMPSHRQLVLNEWHQVALVVDRLMFCIYTLITIFVTIIVCSHG